MNLYFWLATMGMLFAGIIFLVYPLLRPGKRSSLAYRESNIRLHEEKLKELDQDLSEERIGPEEYKVARFELDRELLGDVPEESVDTAAVHFVSRKEKRPIVAIFIAIFVPMFSFITYMQLGMHAGSEMQDMDSQGQASVAEMTAKLEERLRESGGDVEEWIMLGRAFKHLGRYQDSADAFATAVSVEPDAQIMLEQAEALALNNNHKFDIKARELILDALSLEPDNVNAIWFAGVVEYQFGRFRSSIEHLSRLSRVASVDEELNRSIHIYIEQARKQLVAKGEQVPGVEQILKESKNIIDIPGDVVVEPARQTRLEVNVDVPEEVRKAFSGNETVFIFAKAIDGPNFPLAVQKVTLSQLPMTAILDDSMAMMDGMNLSAFDKVILSARISQTGAAMAQSGDYEGELMVEDTSRPGPYKILISTPIK